MPHFIFTVPYAIVQLVVYSLICFFGTYLLIRHAFLITGKLHPRDFGCSNWCKLLLSSMSFGLYSPTLYSSGKMIGPGLFMTDSSMSEKTATTPRSRSTFSGIVKPNQLNSHGTAFYSTIVSTMMFTLCNFLLCLLLMGKDGFKWLSFYSACDESSKLNSVCYILAKSLMYLVFICRLDVAFQGSSHAYPSWMIQCLYALLIIVASILIVWASIASSAERITMYHSTQSHKKSNVAGSHPSHPMSLIGTMAAMDIFFTTTIAGLFTRALRKMFIAGGLNNQKIDPGTAELRLLPLKYTVISVVGVISTLLALIFYGMTRAVILIGFDMAINMLCLLLMNGLWKPAYMLICTPLLELLVRDRPYWAGLVQTAVDINKEQRQMVLFDVTKNKPVSNNNNMLANQVMSKTNGIQISVSPYPSMNDDSAY